MQFFWPPTRYVRRFGQKNYILTLKKSFTRPLIKKFLRKLFSDDKCKDVLIDLRFSLKLCPYLLYFNRSLPLVCKFL